MKTRPLKPPIPRPAKETVRQTLIELLRSDPCSVRELSVRAHIAEKEVYSHLEHIRSSIHGSGSHLEVIPSECRGCGFVFAKRERLAPPGKCPVCRKETISEPLFTIRERKQ